MNWNEEILTVGDITISAASLTLPYRLSNSTNLDLDTALNPELLSELNRVTYDAEIEYFKIVWALRSQVLSNIGQPYWVIIKDEWLPMKIEELMLPITTLWKLPTLPKPLFIELMVKLDLPTVQKPISCPEGALTGEALKQWLEITSRFPKIAPTNLQDFWHEFLSLVDGIGITINPAMIDACQVVFEVVNPEALTFETLERIEDINNKYFKFEYIVGEGGGGFAEPELRRQNLNTRLHKKVIIAGFGFGDYHFIQPTMVDV